jgi:hypothetical protein
MKKSWTSKPPSRKRRKTVAIGNKWTLALKESLMDKMKYWASSPDPKRQVNGQAKV